MILHQTPNLSSSSPDFLDKILGHPTFVNFTPKNGEYRNWSDSNPSFVLSEKGWFDFKRNEGGSLKSLAFELGVDRNYAPNTPPAPKRSAPQQRKPKISKEKLERIYSGSIPGTETIRQYFKTRGLVVDEKTISQIGLKLNRFKSDTSLIAPIKDAQGEISKLHRIGLDRQNAKLWKRQLGSFREDHAIFFGDLDSKRLAIFEGLEDGLTYYLRGDSSDRPSTAVLITSSVQGFRYIDSFLEKFEEKTLFLDPDKDHQSIKASKVLGNKVQRKIPTLGVGIDLNKAHLDGKAEEWIESLREVSKEEAEQAANGFCELREVFGEFGEKVLINSRVSEKKELIDEILTSGEDVNLSAGTGLGKTTAILKSALADKRFQNESRLGIKILLLVPYQALAKQLESQWKVQTIMEGEGIRGDDRLEDICVCVYESLRKIVNAVSPEKLKEYVLVIDEAHHQFIDRSFRKESLRFIEKSERLFKKTVRMTGTGEGLFSEKIKTVVFETKKKQNPYGKAVLYKYGDQGKEKLVDLIVKNQKSEEAQLVFHDSKEGCKIIKEQLRKLGIKKTACLSAEEKEGEIYKSLRDFGKFPEDLDVLLTTKLIEDGISINDPRVRRVYTLDVTDVCEIRQMAARCRDGYDCLHILRSFKEKPEDKIRTSGYFQLEKKIKTRRKELEKMSENMKRIQAEHSRNLENLETVFLPLSAMAPRNAHLFDEDTLEADPYALRMDAFSQIQRHAFKTPENFQAFFKYLEKQDIEFRDLSLRKCGSVRESREEVLAVKQECLKKTDSLLLHDPVSLIAAFAVNIDRSLIDEDYFQNHNPLSPMKEYFEEHKETLLHPVSKQAVKAFLKLESVFGEDQAASICSKTPLNARFEIYETVRSLKAVDIYTRRLFRASQTPEYLALKYLMTRFRKNRLESFSVNKLTSQINRFVQSSLKAEKEEIFFTGNQVRLQLKRLFKLEESRIKFGKGKLRRKVLRYGAVSLLDLKDLSLRYNLGFELKPTDLKVRKAEESNRTLVNLKPGDGTSQVQSGRDLSPDPPPSSLDSKIKILTSEFPELVREIHDSGLSIAQAIQKAGIEVSKPPDSGGNFL